MKRFLALLVVLATAFTTIDVSKAQLQNLKYNQTNGRIGTTNGGPTTNGHYLDLPLGTTLNGGPIGGGVGGIATIATGLITQGVTASFNITDPVNVKLNIGLGAITPTSVNGIVFTGVGTPALTVTGAALVSGNNTGDQSSVTGNAGTATKLATARNINGVPFDGTANITVTAAGSTLSDNVPISKGGTGQVAVGSALQLLRTKADLTGTEWASISIGGGDALTANNLDQFTDVTQSVGATLNISFGANTLNGGTFSGTNTGDQSSVTGNAGTATALQTARLIGNVSFNGTADITPQRAEAGSEVSDTTNFPLFLNTASNTPQQSKFNSNFTYNAATNTVTVGTILANLTGSVTGNASTASTLQTPRLIGGTSFDGSADITPLQVTPALETIDTTNFILFDNANTATPQQPKVNTALGYNAVTNAITANLTGVVTGNASTATALATARQIGGVNFDGTANITPQQILPASDTTDTAAFIPFFNASTSTAQQPKFNAALGYNSATNTVTSNLVGNVTGNADTVTNGVTALAPYANDNRVLRSDGGAKGSQASVVTLDDTGNMSGIDTVTATDATTNTLTLLDDVDQLFGLEIHEGDNVTANRKLTVFSGAFDLILRLTGNTDLTLPTSGTILTSGGSGTFAGLTDTSYLRLTGIVSPTLTTSPNHNYDPGFPASIVRLDPGASNRVISGLLAQSDGTIVELLNISTTTARTITFNDSDTNSSVANRFLFGNQNVAIAGGQSIVVWYDFASTSWRPFGRHSGNVATAGTYGSATQVPVFVLGADGRITGTPTNTTVTATTPAYTGDVTSSAGGTVNTLVNIPSAVPAAGHILFSNGVPPGSVASGKDAVYTDLSELRFHDKNASGSIGTTVVADAGATNNFLTGISTAGVVTKAQPSFANLSGSATGAQLPNPSSSTLGGVQSFAAVTNQWINAVSTSGVHSSTQPGFSNLSGTIANSQIASGVQLTAPAIQAGSATAGSWPTMASGALLTTPVADTIEHDSTDFQWYGTSDVTSGRGHVELVHRFFLGADGSAITTIANFFGTNSAISLVANTRYVLRAHLNFTKNTGASIQWSITNQNAYTNLTGFIVVSPTAGTGGAGTIAGTFPISKTNADGKFQLTASLTGTPVDHIHEMFVDFEMGTAGKIEIQVSTGTGNVTPLRGSYFEVYKIPTANVGTFQSNF